MRILPAVATAILLTAATATHAACMRCDPILNIADAPVTSASGKPLTNDQVKGAIIRAGAGLGWIMKEAGPGKLTAEIEIPYSSRAYGIQYKNSTNLDAADGQIHKNYNGWIQNLNKNINAQLAAS